MLLLACVAVRPAGLAPAPEEASQALAEARSLLRRGDGRNSPADREAAREAALRARASAPDWVAPQRFLDDLLREDLLGVQALDEHQRALKRVPWQADRLYLAGRLHGRSGAAYFERAVNTDARVAWGHHGLAWWAASRARYREAIKHGRRALERARDPWERSFFLSSLARYHVGRGERERALELISQGLEEPDLLPADRTELAVQAAGIALDALDLDMRRAGEQRAIELIRDRSLTSTELRGLVLRLRGRESREDPERLELQLALGHEHAEGERHPVRDRLRAELLLDAKSTPLALALLEQAVEREGRSLVGGPLLRRARFAADSSQFLPAVEGWLQELPSSALNSDGLPRDGRLRAVVHSAREYGLRSAGDAAGGRIEALAALGASLIDAGWFREARAVAARLGGEDLGRGLELEDRAALGLGLLHGLRRSLLGLELSDPDDGQSQGAREDGDSGGAARNLREFLTSLGPAAARAHEVTGADPNPERASTALRESPLLDYGWVGSVVHPGPRFSRADEDSGLGRAGQPVPGLAHTMQALGRFALIGEVLGGGGPDGAVLARLVVEQQAGEHLGVPWSGTVALCEGSDLLSRAGRRGARIAGAALHEGYWIDVQVLREEWERWDELRRDFSGAEKAERVRSILESRGLSIDVPASDRKRLRRERRGADALLGEYRLVRLAIMRDRARSFAAGDAGEPALDAPGLVTPTLDELVTATATHEQGHLCDRTRFLPIHRNLGGVLKLAVTSNLSPAGVQRTLEYRAQLVALCEVPDPRLCLSDVLAGAEGAGASITPHGDAYRELLEDWLAVLDRELEKHPEDYPELDPGFLLAHQLHHLEAERVRSVSLKLARRRGLVSD